MPTVVINPDSGLAEALPEDQAQQGLQAGTHHIPLLDAEGKLVGAPFSEAGGLLQQGYTQPGQEDLDKAVRYGEASSPTRQAITGLEGAASAMTFGASSGLERTVGSALMDLTRGKFGWTPEQIRDNAEVNPGVHALGEAGGLGIGMLYGAGEAGVLAKAGQGAVELAGLAKAGGLAGKAGAALVRGAAETALMGAGDEVSNALLSDPHQSVSSAMSHILMSGAMGGALGGTLGLGFGTAEKAWQKMSGNKVGQIIEDMKGAFERDLHNPDPVAGVTEQLKQRVANMEKAQEAVYSGEGIKAQSLAAHLPEMNEKMAEQAQTLNARLEAAAKSIHSSKVEPFNEAMGRWQTVATKPEVTSAELFDATNALKGELQDFGRFDKSPVLSYNERQFRTTSKNLSREVRLALEDTGAWGKAGDVQKELNKVVSQYFEPLKQFKSTFMSELNGENVINPDKVKTYMNQTGKGAGAIKQGMLGNFLDASDAYAQKVHELYADLGLESPLVNTPQNLLRETLEKKTTGQAIYEALRDKAAARVSGVAIGGTLGHFLLGPFGGTIGAGLAAPIAEKVLPGIIKPLLQKASNSAGLKAALEFGVASLKGENALARAAKDVFAAGKILAPQTAFPDVAHLQVFKKQLDAVQKDPTKLLNMGGDLHHYLPDHHSEAAQTIARASTYLNTLKPSTEKSAPLDQNRKVNSTQQGTYDRAVGLIQKPMASMGLLKEGRLTSQDMRTLNAVYPGWVQRTQAKLMEEIVNQTSKGQVIPYKTRIGLSVFMGMALDSTMTPAAMQLMRPPQAPVMPPPQAAGGKTTQSGLNKMGKANKLYMTPNQQAEARRMVK